jgi:hypothetical protein
MGQNQVNGLSIIRQEHKNKIIPLLHQYFGHRKGLGGSISLFEAGYGINNAKIGKF